MTLCRIGLHRYRTVADTGVTEYGECRCGKRRVRQRSMYQPIDRAWLNRETDELFRPLLPPPGPNYYVTVTPTPLKS